MRYRCELTLADLERLAWMRGDNEVADLCGQVLDQADAIEQAEYALSEAESRLCDVRDALSLIA